MFLSINCGVFIMKGRSNTIRVLLLADPISNNLPHIYMFFFSYYLQINISILRSWYLSNNYYNQKFLG